jgi:Rrf2 family protein
VKISTRGRYGARFMLDLALHFGEGPVLLRDVSKRQEISVKYLEQLVTPLRVAGLVKSTRGPHGGYHLAKPPSEIDLYSVLSILEGPCALTECVADGSVCHRSGTCVTREIWQEVSERICNHLKAISLKEMVKRQVKRQSQNSNMYHI